MKKSLLIGAALATLLTVSAAPASSQEVFDFNYFMTMADRNKDGAVTRQEFLEAMGKAYDMNMTRMKKMKDSGKMVKGDRMTRDGLKELFSLMYVGA